MPDEPFELVAIGKDNIPQTFVATCEHHVYPDGTGEIWSYRVWLPADNQRFLYAEIALLDAQTVYVKSIHAHGHAELSSRGIPAAIYRDVTVRSGRTLVSSSNLRDGEEFRTEDATRSWEGLERRNTATYDLATDRFTFLP